MKDINIIKFDDYYNTSGLPFNIWVDNIKTDKDRKYFCDQKGSKLRCLLKLSTSRDQVFYENFGCELGELFAEYTNKFIQNVDVSRPLNDDYNKLAQADGNGKKYNKKYRPTANIKFLTQHSTIVKYDEEKYPRFAEIYNRERNFDHKKITHYATLIYCFTANKYDLQNFQLRLSNHSDFNDCLPKWLEYFDIDENLKSLTFDEKMRIKEQIVYSFLFRNCFNDCDFTARNFGLLYDKKKISLAPNFDYGEFLSSVKMGKFFNVEPVDKYIFPDMEHHKRMTLIQKMIESNEKRKVQLANMTPELLAHEDLSNSNNLYNIKYACKYFPHVVYQFIEVIKRMEYDENSKQVITNMVKNYTIADGEYHILNQEKFDFILEYMSIRMKAFIEILQKRLNHYISKGYIKDKDEYLTLRKQSKIDGLMF